MSVFENSMRKEGNTGYKHFLQQLAFIQKSYSSGFSVLGIVWEMVKDIPYGYETFGLVLNVGFSCLMATSRKHFGKRRKCWVPAFSTFPKMFSKALLHKFLVW